MIIITTFAVPEQHQHKVLMFGIIIALLLRAVVSDNVLVKAANRMLPVTTEYDGGRLVTRRSGTRAVTPLFIVLVAIGSTDLLFALDSVPAVFGVTQEPYIVLTANAFALLGLRPLFFLVKGLLDRLVYLSSGLALILAFVRVKLALHWGHTVNTSVPEISTGVSLAGARGLRLGGGAERAARSARGHRWRPGDSGPRWGGALTVSGSSWEPSGRPRASAGAGRPVVPSRA